MRDWWNHGIHTRSLVTYRFLVKCNVLERLFLLQVGKWQARIHEMLSHTYHLLQWYELVFLCPMVTMATILLLAMTPVMVMAIIIDRDYGYDSDDRRIELEDRTNA
jgi:hypothetical protein